MWISRIEQQRTSPTTRSPAVEKIEVESGRILGSIESPGHMVTATPARIVYVASLTATCSSGSRIVVAGAAMKLLRKVCRLRQNEAMSSAFVRTAAGISCPPSHAELHCHRSADFGPGHRVNTAVFSAFSTASCCGRFPIRTRSHRDGLDGQPQQGIRETSRPGPTTWTAEPERVVLPSFAGFNAIAFNLTGADEPERLQGAQATANSST